MSTLSRGFAALATCLLTVAPMAQAQTQVATSLDDAIECAAHFQRLIPQDAGADADGALFGLLSSRALEEAEIFAAKLPAASRPDIDVRVADRLAELAASIGGGPSQQKVEAGFRGCFARYMAN
jgi:hypothetical protein